MSRSQEDILSAGGEANHSEGAADSSSSIDRRANYRFRVHESMKSSNKRSVVAECDLKRHLLMSIKNILFMFLILSESHNLRQTFKDTPVTASIMLQKV